MLSRLTLPSTARIMFLRPLPVVDGVGFDTPLLNFVATTK